MAIALALALVLNRKMRGLTFYRAVYFAPVVTAAVAVSLVWQILYNTQYGLINYILNLLHLPAVAWLEDPHWAMPAVKEELGAQLGYGPWSLVWWWMQNEPDPLKRIAVTNSWAEANLMHTLRLWRTHAEQRGYTRIAELADYLQADELTHVKLATRWIRQLTAHDPGYREELAQWGRKAVERIGGFYGRPVESELHFTFLKPGHGEPSGSPTAIIGE